MTTPIRKSLNTLLQPEGLAAPASLWVSDITLHSDDVTPGSLFIAVAGHQYHGLQFVEQAIANGAQAILWESAPGISTPEVPPGVVAIEVADLKPRVSRIAGRFFGEPSQSIKVVGVTGTNGKTTIAHLIAHAYQNLNIPSAFIGTIGVGPVNQLRPSKLTTFDAVTVQRILAGFRDRGIRVVAMEVSSHALAQYRVDGVHFHNAVFSNLTHDHLDYHHTVEQYGAVKARLFTELAADRAVINIGDDFGLKLWRQMSDDRLRLAVTTTDPQAHGENLLVATAISESDSGSRVEFVSRWGNGTMPTQLLGRFNVTNALSALAVLLLDRIPMMEAALAMSKVPAPPGRMEIFAGNPLRPTIVVDYAHTPDALAQVLESLRSVKRGQLWCVFGCGGDRDQAKRPLMGQVADQFADQIVVTSDNPRNEDPLSIIDQIVAGIEANQPFTVQPDRRQAIAECIKQAGADDLVLIAGKGHEDYQEGEGNQRIPLSDRCEVVQLLKEDLCSST